MEADTSFSGEEKGIVGVEKAAWDLFIHHTAAPAIPTIPVMIVAQGTEEYADVTGRSVISVIREERTVPLLVSTLLVYILGRVVNILGEGGC